MLGIGMTLLAICLFTVMDTIGKSLTAHYPFQQVVWARYFFQFALMLVMLPQLGIAGPPAHPPPRSADRPRPAARARHLLHVRRDQRGAAGGRLHDHLHRAAAGHRAVGAAAQGAGRLAPLERRPGRLRGRPDRDPAGLRRGALAAGAAAGHGRLLRPLSDPDAPGQRRPRRDAVRDAVLRRLGRRRHHDADGAVLLAAGRARRLALAGRDGRRSARSAT